MADAMDLEDPDYLPIPSYYQCTLDIYFTARSNFDKMTTNHSYVEDLFSELQRYCAVSAFDVFLSIGLATFLTLLRYILTIAIFTPLARRLGLSVLNQTKFPESAWKALYYSCIWLCSLYLLVLSGRYDFFHKPQIMWRDWSPLRDVPTDIYIMYAFEFSFYVHSIYATVYMDRWRKDSIVMIFHHLLSVFLLGFSYAIRYYKVGVLIIFLHDIADVWLEMTKIAVYLKDCSKRKYYAIFDNISVAGFVIFGCVWFVCRLYWFPLKVLYITGHAVYGYMPPHAPPFYFFFNIMLWVLLVLNVYWFMFIVMLVYKVATGQMREVDDLREVEVEQKLAQSKLRRRHNDTNNMAEPLTTTSAKPQPTTEPTTNGIRSRKMGVD